MKHWLPSLQENVDLSDIDVNVLDYGLSDAQRKELADRGVCCHRCIKDGQVGDIRIRDVAAISARLDYDQVLSVDSGDLIFQSDISSLFEQDKEHFRGVCEDLFVPLHHVFMDLSDFPAEVRRRVLSFLYDKPIVNGGFILGPPAKFQKLWDTFHELGVGYQCFATDQIVFNYVAYRDGFRRLDKRYNFVTISMLSPFFIRDGKIYDSSDTAIPVVHNAGMKAFSRKIKNFGYGPEYNQKQWFYPLLTRCIIHLGNFWKFLTYRLLFRVKSPS